MPSIFDEQGEALAHLSEGAALSADRPTFVEWFSGGGLARVGLGTGWDCHLAVDFNARKGRFYTSNFGRAEFRQADIRTFPVADVPPATLWWASSPCQDLSAAGLRAGLTGERSGTFWAVVNLLHHCIPDGRAPDILVIENVAGAITSNDGREFVRFVTSMASAGYRIGGLVLDGARWVPQSRLRLFLVAVRAGVVFPEHLVLSAPDRTFHPNVLVKAVRALPSLAAKAWTWWRLPEPPPMKRTLVDILEPLDAIPADLWLDRDRSDEWLAALAPDDLARLQAAMASPRRTAVTANVRSREMQHGRSRLHPRWDGLSNCLNAPKGPRQIIIDIVDGRARVRLLTVGELARLSGLPAWYRLPESNVDVGHLVGDGLVVPAVEWLARHLLDPLAGLRPAAAGPALDGPTRDAGMPVSQYPMTTPDEGDTMAVIGKPKGIKAATRGTTLYVLPEELRRLKRIALDLDVSLHELAILGFDRVLAEQGQPPVTRYVPSPRRKALT